MHPAFSGCKSFLYLIYHKLRVTFQLDAFGSQFFANSSTFSSQTKIALTETSRLLSRSSTVLLLGALKVAVDWPDIFFKSYKTWWNLGIHLKSFHFFNTENIVALFRRFQYEYLQGCYSPYQPHVFFVSVHGCCEIHTKIGFFCLDPTLYLWASYLIFYLC